MKQKEKEELAKILSKAHDWKQGAIEADEKRKKKKNFIIKKSSQTPTNSHSTESNFTKKDQEA